MNLKATIFSKIKLMMIVGLAAGSILFHACEDDAILEPQKTNQDNGGSYGNLRIATPSGENNKSAGDSVAVFDSHRKEVKNPRIY